MPVTIHDRTKTSNRTPHTDRLAPEPECPNPEAGA